MKKLLLLIIASLTFNIGFSQIKRLDDTPEKLIGEAKTLHVVHASLKQIGDDYVLVYRDMKYSKLDNYKSVAIPREDFEDFYKLCIESLDTQEKIKFQLGNDLVSLSPEKNMGKRLVIQHTSSAGVSGFTYNFSPKQLKKLFGK